MPAMQSKGPKRKPKFKAIPCLAWMMKLLWKHSKSITVAAFAVIPITIILYALNLYLTPAIIQMFEAQEEFRIIALTIFVLILSQLMFALIKDWIDRKREIMTEIFQTLILTELFVKDCDLEFYLFLDPAHREKKNRAGYAAFDDGIKFPTRIANIIVSILCFTLFGSVIATLNPWIILLLCASSLFNFFARKYKAKKDYTSAHKRDLNRKKMDYIARKLGRDMRPGKDIRLFSMQNFLNERTIELLDEYKQNFAQLQNTSTFVQVVSLTLDLLRDGIAYAFLLYLALRGEMSVAEFSLYFSAISQLSHFFSGIIGEVDGIFTAALRVSDVREYMELKGELNRGEGLPPRRGCPVSVELKNVSYRYPEGTKDVIRNVSMKIEAGEKVALVGVNGAGKTTLVSLMCGLLIPTEGEVLIDGHSIYEYNKEELYRFFSMIPQEYTLLPSSIAENVTLCETGERDIDRMNDCLKQAGLWDKVQSLEHGAESLLEGRYNPNGIRLSGGETQKLLLARSLYRNAQIMILDEPTAALDPIAEDAMYRKYIDTVRNSTSIFISHRLASTRFCDRIYVMDGAGLAECGTHEELVQAGGKYQEMFDVQSKYYKDEEVTA